MFKISVPARAAKLFRLHGAPAHIVAACLWAACALSLGAAAHHEAQPAGQSAAAPVVTPAADYLIGAEDVLGVVFWREPDLSGDVTVRPDDRISVPVIGEVEAAGLTPDALRQRLHTAAGKYLTDVNVAVVVRQINSRKIFVTGQVATPGPYPLSSPRTVMQALAMAGGLTEFADAKQITVLRSVGEKAETFRFNYRDVARGRNLQQNILLLPGDTVVVP